jgi:hypothetical protein
LQRSAIAIAATSPTVTLPTVEPLLAAKSLSHPINSVQPLPMYHDGGFDWTRANSLTTIITITISVPSIVPPHVPRVGWFVRWLVRRAVCWPARSVRVWITNVLTFTAVAKVMDVPVIHSCCPATLRLIAVV